VIAIRVVLVLVVDSCIPEIGAGSTGTDHTVCFL
jgi:hypothetical protein